MKVLEQLLFDLDTQNYAKTITDIQGQLDYYSKYKMEVEAISLIPVRDLLDPKFTDEVLRNSGYILTISQLKEDGAKFLELAAKNPIFYNSRLKRLHRGIQILQENYIKAKVANKSVIKEMTNHFTQVLTAIYGNGTTGQKMPDDLSTRITKMNEVVIEKMSERWLKRELSPETHKELTDLLVTSLLSDAQQNKLDALVSKQLEDEKNKINSIDALVSHFREKKLPEQVQHNILTAIVGELTIRVNSKQITQNSALGSAIKTIRNSALKNDNFEVYSTLVTNWQNKQSTVDETKQLETIISDVILKMKQNLESTLTQQFAQLAASIFLSKLQDGEYNNNKDLLDVMNKYNLNIAKQLLLFSNPCDKNNTLKCREAVNNEVMYQLHGLWLNEKLSVAENEFIKVNVFASLNELVDKIEQKVWPNKSKQNVEAMANELANVKSELAGTKVLLQQILARLPNATQTITADINTIVSAAIAEPNSRSTPGFFKK